MQTHEFHPLANLFPLIEGQEFDDLVASVREHGLREAISLFDGMILDGRNRYRACEAAKVEPRFVTLPSDCDPFAFVSDKNVHRRHLNASQRALIAARMTNMRAGDNQYTKGEVTGQTVTSISIPKAASLLNVNKDTITNARTILAKADPEEIKAAREGKVSLKALAKQLRENVPHAERVKRFPNGGPSAAKMNAKIWGELRDALVHLTSLPQPSEVVRIARFSDKAGLVNARLFTALQYLKEFANAWSSPSKEPDSDDQSDTGTGD